MSRLLVPTPCSFPRHSSVYRYSSVESYLPATFQFHSTSISVRTAPAACLFLADRIQFWTTKSDKFLLFSISVAGEQRLQSSPRIPLRGRGRSMVGAIQLVESGRGPKSAVWRSGEISVARLARLAVSGDAPLMSSGHPANCEDVLLVSRSARVSPLTRFCI